MRHEIEAAFKRLGWTCRTEVREGESRSFTTIMGRTGRRLVDVLVGDPHPRILVRVGTGLLCPAERLPEMNALLSALNFTFDSAAFGVAPSGQVVARARVLNVRPGRHVRRLVVTALEDANKSVDAFGRAFGEVASGRMTAAEVLDALREPSLE